MERDDRTFSVGSIKTIAKELLDRGYQCDKEAALNGSHISEAIYSAQSVAYKIAARKLMVAFNFNL